MELNQYKIVLVNLDPTVGGEIRKTRPCVIISPNEMNKYLRTVVVAPITSSSKAYVTRIEIKKNDTAGWVVIDQVRTIGKSRIIKIFGSLSENEITEVKAAIKEAYVD